MIPEPVVLLARFAWPIDDGAGVRDAAGGDIEVFRAIERDEGYAYASVARAALPQVVAALGAAYPSVAIATLQRMQDVAGASAGLSAPFRYVVETDVQPTQEDDFNAWYEREHLPGLASVDGTVRAMRFRTRDGDPRYHACYDLARQDTLGSPAWLAVRATPWSGRVRPHFVNTRRTMFRRVQATSSARSAP